LAKGLLTGKFNTNSRFEDIRASDPEFVGTRFQRNLRVVAELAKIAAGYDKTVAQLALNWTGSVPGVTAPIVGVKRPSQVLENVGAVGWSLTEEDRARIDVILRS
jgi:aryl-alcohol dehydrogenase-like predicted oxidoreductase